MLTFGSLFAGIGGFDLGLERAGMRCAWQVEIDPFCRAVLAKHWPDVPKFKDVRYVGRNELATVDLVCGGFPCQDVSLAGKRAGMEGERTTLWTEFSRIIRELRPKWVLAENVPGLLSSDAGRFFGEVLRTLAASGYDVEWDCIPASAFGAPHRRDRIYILADSEGGRLAPSISEMYSESDAGWRRYYSCQPGILGERSPWAVEPNVGRVATGVSRRVDRLRALGNAVVPQVAEWIGWRIIEADGAAGVPVPV